MHISQHFPVKLLPATFRERPNRFVARVAINGRRELAHVPSSGRMQELLVPGATVYLAPAGNSNRVTGYDLLLVESGGILVSVDSLLPNRLIREAFARKVIQDFKPYTEIKSEFTYGGSRFDFLLASGAKRCLVEVKSVTLVKKGVAMFPDAPSARGVKHLLHLREARREGYEAAVIFVAQREDARCFSPNAACDAAFASALKEALGAGVKLYAFSCRVTPEMVELSRGIPACT